MAEAWNLIVQKKGGEFVNSWWIAREMMRAYGHFYLQCVYVALIVLGTNVPEDAAYPMTAVDSDGKYFNSSHRYVLYFSKEYLPSVKRLQ